MTIRNHAMRINSHAIGQKRVSGRALECNTWLNTMPRPMAWIITVTATRPEPIKRLVIIAALKFSWLLIGGFLKIFYGVCDTFEAIDSTQFPFHTVVTEPVTNGRACFDRLEPDALGGQFISHAGKSVSALQVHARRSGEIEH